MNGMPAATAAQKKLMTSDAWLRLALLVVPVTLVVEAAFRHPFLCACGCVAVLATWLCADFGPFRAAVSGQPATAKNTQPPAPSPMKGPWWNYFFCRSIIIFAIVFSKLTS